jgi:hypothetical protein
MPPRAWPTGLGIVCNASPFSFRFFMCKIMSVIWYAQGNGGKTAKESVTMIFNLKC